MANNAATRKCWTIVFCLLCACAFIASRDVRSDEVTHNYDYGYTQTGNDNSRERDSITPDDVMTQSLVLGVHPEWDIETDQANTAMENPRMNMDDTPRHSYRGGYGHKRRKSMPRAKNLLISAPPVSYHDTQLDNAVDSGNDSLTDIWLLGLFPFDGPWPGGLGQLPAIQMGVEDVNKHPDILPGYRLRITINDTSVSILSIFKVYSNLITGSRSEWVG